MWWYFTVISLYYAFFLKEQAKSHCYELAGCGKRQVHEGLTHFVSPKEESVLASLVVLVI